MKRHIKIALIAITGALLINLSACKKKEETTSTQVELLSFGLAGAKPGDNIHIIGNNLDRVTAVEFAGGQSVAKAAFSVQNAENITVAVPANIGPGKITLKTPDGDVVSKSMLNLLVTVEVTSFTTNVKAGGLVTVNGDYLNWVSEIVIGGKDKVKVFESQSPTALVFKVPAWLTPGNYTLSFACRGTRPVNLQPATLMTVIP